MKRTYAVNIAGYAFTIDENAYELLNRYLDTVEKAFRNSEFGDDVSQDIELRVAELLTERSSKGSPIITLDDVTYVIERIGQPEEFSEEIMDEEPAEKLSHSTPPPYYKPAPVIKKLYRDPENSMLGGVCSGLAYYFGVDVTLIRLLTVLLFFLSVTTVAIAYIILWIVVPAANTPFQRMQMKGETPTMDNIGKNVTDNSAYYESGKVNYNPDNDRQKKSTRGRMILNVLLVILAVILSPVVLIILFILIVFFLALIGALFEVGTDLTDGLSIGNVYSSDINTWIIILFVFGLILFFGIPLFMLLSSSSYKNKLRNSAWRIFFSIIMWIIGILLIIFPLVYYGRNIERLNLPENKALEMTLLEELKEEISTETNDSIFIKSKIMIENDSIN